jgi:uncharacterized membrane protein YhaH (DUF805 family)
MDYAWLLFSFKGRINRAKNWLAALIILGWMIFVLSVLAAVATTFGFGGPLAIDVFGISASIRFTDEPSSVTSLFPQIVTIPMTLLFGWCYAAASIKRLHDRNKSGWWSVPYIVAPGLYSHFGALLATSLAGFFVGTAVSIAFLWGFVELCFLRGTRGPNRFGPDPLPKTQARPRGDRTGWQSSSAWDQHSELEFLPYSAGPSAGPHVKRGT